MLAQRVGLRGLQRFASRSAQLRASTRQYSAPSEGSLNQSGFKLQDNAFNRERAANKAHAGGSAEFWRKLSIYVAIPCLLIASANAYTLWNEHWEHEAHMPPPEERPQYAYLNLRSKPYPWGDGNKTLFWNDKVNYVKED
ncbi:cytochrome c oxidase subunit VIa [Microthyrium microscopicum]|uniref:Cytochrome c oxidase subunit n=1 Tax=Microthyrium microscopicum TaxID=703497 RepID=A0A6A6UVH2_9PEZI|nr:cytochrome c oxidase subunit VIa [Microthyrium microscopicum]